MVMSGTLFRAILAMDAYNRGYNEGIKLPDILGTTKIGNATISNQSNVLSSSDEVAAGFYAISYSYQGGTVISYRGTDVPLSQDILNGWGTGAGSITTPQAKLAADFFKAVIGDDNPTSRKDVEFVGHSLGGGLAGLMASIYGGNMANIFDNMSFEDAANDNYNKEMVNIIDNIVIPSMVA